MRIPRLYLEATDLELDQVIELDKSRSHYVGNVLRQKNGSSLLVFNNTETEYTVEITAMTRNSVEIKIKNKQTVSRESTLKLKLTLSVSKNQHMDIALKKAVETGVQEIQPIISQYSSIKLEKGRLDNKREHWKKLIISACEQCGRTRLPVLYEPLSINDYLSQTSTVTRLMLLPGATKRFADITSEEKYIELLIGPEGGFTDDEESRAKDAAFEAVNLGHRILRTETAVIAAVSVCQTIWGDY